MVDLVLVMVEMMPMVMGILLLMLQVLVQLLDFQMVVQVPVVFLVVEVLVIIQLPMNLLKPLKKLVMRHQVF